MWTRSRELFFSKGDQIMVADYSVEGQSFVASKPRPWLNTFPEQVKEQGYNIGMNLSPDGKRIVIFPVPAGWVAQSSIHVSVLLKCVTAMSKRPDPAEVRALLADLCVKLGFCLPPLEIERLTTSLHPCSPCSARRSEHRWPGHPKNR